MNIAAILAGGSGRRFGSPTPKQFLQLAGKTVIEHSIDTFCQHPDIDEVAVVVHPDYRDTMQAIADRRGWSKLKRIINGGAERYHSSLNAILEYHGYPDNTNILIHDAARPLLTAAVIDRVIASLSTNEAVGVGITSSDTVWVVKNEHITDIPDRKLLWRAQTPQAFHLGTLRRAYSEGMHAGLVSTDDCGVVARYTPDVKICLVEGDECNIKITTATDLTLAETLLAIQQRHAQ